MKTLEEIEKKHDFLHAILEYNHHQPEDDQMPREIFIPLHAAHDALSWVLDGPCKGPFEENCKMLEEKLTADGYRFIKKPLN